MSKNPAHHTGLLRLRDSGLVVGQALEQASDWPGGPQFYNRGMVGYRAQDAQGGLHVRLPTGDGVQKNRLAAEENQPPRLLVWGAFPPGAAPPPPTRRGPDK